MAASALLVGALLVLSDASTSRDRLDWAVSLEGAWTDRLTRSVWVHDPSSEVFPALRPGVVGSLSGEFGGPTGVSRWAPDVAVGLRVGSGSWTGASSDRASLWELGLKGRVEFVLGVVRPWFGVGAGVSGAWVRAGDVERSLLLWTNTLSLGVRLRVSGPISVGLFAETWNSMSFARPEEILRTDPVRVGAELVLHL